MYRRVCLSALLLLSIAPAAYAGMTGTSYRIDWDSLNAGGNEAGSSASYTLQDTMGEAIAGNASSASYQLQTGYRSGLDQEERISLSLFAQNTPSPQSAYSAFNVGARTVTVATPGAFTVGDEVAIEEGYGVYTQLVSVGRITSIVGNDLTLDVLSGDQSLMSASPSPGTAAVFLLSGSSVAFGTLVTSTHHVVTVGTEAQSTAPLGYSVYMQGATLLQNASLQSIATVLDSAVTQGSEEYGAEVTGSTAAGPTGDQGVTTTARLIQASGSATGATPDRVRVVFKIAITESTNPGSYSQTVYYTLTPRF